VAEDWLDIEAFDPSKKVRRAFSIPRAQWEALTPEQQIQVGQSYGEIVSTEEAASKAEAQKTLEQAVEETAGRPIRRLETGAPAEFGGGSVGEFFARASAARSSDPQDRVNILKKRLPDHEIFGVRAPSGETVVALNDPKTQDTVLLDSRAFTWLDASADTLYDIASWENLLGIGAAALTGPAGVAGRLGWMARVGAQTLGGFTGAYIDEAQRREAGVENDTQTVLEMAARNVGVSAVGESLPAFIRMRWGTSLTDEDKQMVQTWGEWKALAKQRGVKMRGATVADRQSLATRLVNQAKQSSYKVKADLVKREEGVRAGFEQAIADTGGDLSKLSNDELSVLQMRLQDHMTRLLSPKIEGVGTDKDTLLLIADALKSGRKEMVQLQKAQFSKDYADLHELSQGVIFDMHTPVGKEGKSVIETAKEAMEGVPVRGAEGEMALRKPSAKLQKILKDLLEMNPTIEQYKNSDPLLQLQAMRGDLLDLKYAAIPDQNTVDNRLAGKVYDAITDLMDKPVGGSDHFAVALRAVNERYKQFNDMLELPLVKEIGLTNEPQRVLFNMFTPNNAHGIKALAAGMPPEKWGMATAGVRTWLREHPDLIEPKLAEWRGLPEVKALVVSPEQERALVSWAGQIRRLENGPVAQAFQKGLDARAAAKDIFSNPTAERLKGLQDAIAQAGGKDSEFGKALRAGLLTEIGEAGTGKASDRAVDLGALSSAIDRFRKTGIIDTVMTPTEADLLKRSQFSFARSVTSGGGDVGASLQSAQLASGVAAVAEVPGTMLIGEAEKSSSQSIRSLATVWKNYVVGKMLIGGASERTMLSAANTTQGEAWTRILAIAGVRAVESLGRGPVEETGTAAREGLGGFVSGVANKATGILAEWLNKLDDTRKSQGAFDEVSP